MMQLLPDKLFADRRRLYAVLLLPGLLVYLKSINFDFTSMDEQWMILQNARFLDSWESVKQAYTTPLAGMYYRPFFLMTIIVDYQIGKLSPFVYHVTNLAWHLAAVLLMFRFLELFRVNLKLAFTLCLLFSVHPLLLHAVAWIPGRNDIMLCVLSLASLNGLKKYLQDPRLKYALQNILFFYCAMFTKETAIILPFIFLGVLYLENVFKTRKTLSLSLCWIAGALAWYFLRRYSIEYMPAFTESFFDNLLNSAKALLIYLGKMIFPARLSVYPTLTNSSVLPGFMALALLLLVIFRPGMQNRKLGWFGLLFCFMVLFVPVWFSAISTTREHYEHRSYTAFAGFLLFVSQLRLNFNSKAFSLAATALLLFFSIKTFSRMEAYRNKDTFVEYALREAPDFYLFHLQAAEGYYAKGNFPKAIAYFSKAIELRPDKPGLYNNRGGAYFNVAKYKSALSDFNSAIAKDSTIRGEYYLNRCASYHALGDYSSAMKDLLVLLKCCRDKIPPGFEQKLSQQWLAKEIGPLSREIEKDPAQAELYYKRAQAWMSIEQYDQALPDFKKACALEPENQEYLKTYLKVVTLASGS